MFKEKIFIFIEYIWIFEVIKELIVVLCYMSVWKNKCDFWNMCNNMIIFYVDWMFSLEKILLFLYIFLV